MIKGANVWYPESQKKLAMEAFYWRYRAWLSELRKTRQTKSKEKK